MSGGKTYQVTQVDPLNPHTKGMVYQVSVVGGFTQIKEMPEASADNVGIIYQYIGETDSNFTHGFFYESQALGTNPETYGWVRINVQPATDSHNLGWFATESALTTAHPTATDGDYAFVGSTDTVWTWDSDTSAWVNTHKSDYANKDLSNLTATGANIANWSHNVSNCIAETPQDINLTLSAGTLTLKSGSKVYVPNGFQQDGTTPKFDVVTVASDKNVSTGTLTGQAFIMYMISPSVIVYANTLASTVHSGSSVPANYYGIFYDTTANKIDYYDNSVGRGQQFGLPVGMLTASSGTVTSIDQVFNGFGFIGNTVFALPGVKAVVPDGRNADGTLKNLISTIDTVKTGNTYAGTWFYNPYTNYISVAYYTRYFEQETMPSVNCNWYQPSTNIMYHVDNGVATVAHEGKMFNATRESGVYTSLTPYMPFRAVDYSDTEFITHQAMPSTKYTVLSLGTSGNSYTAPADGYYEISLGTDTDRYVQITNNSNNIGTSCVGGTIVSSKAFMVASKGDSVTVYYSGTGAGVSFRFVYANGSK